MTASLLKTGKHVVTALTRIDSQSKLPDGVSVKKIDYEKPETIVEALKGQDALVITLSGMVHGKDLESILINAAGEAGVPWVLPNEWSPDTANEDLIRDISVFQSKRELFVTSSAAEDAHLIMFHSQNAPDDPRTGEEFFHRRLHRLLVRMEPRHSISIWYRSLETQSHTL